MIAIISDKKQIPFSKWLIESLEELQKHNVKGIALVALCEDQNMTGYWNMDQRGRAAAESEIRYDVIDGFIQANLDRYLGGDIEDEEEDTDESE